MSDSTPSTPALAKLGSVTVQRIAEALTAPPTALGEEVDIAERAVVRLRDTLIDMLRTEPPAEDRAHWRGALDQVNAALSLLAAIEYPAGPPQRKQLEQAQAAIQRMLDEGLWG